jgi:malate dehydrogenase (oxaloacetate-decarboxylating)
MAKRPIIFALANPNPEIKRDVALRSGAFIYASGRSDFPNQINNALVFPGIFAGAIRSRTLKITDEHKLAAAKAIAAWVKRPASAR